VQAREPRFFRWRALVGDASGSQLLEFAVALPLLVVFVVGIFDFGAAFNVKQKINNITREAGRFASTLPESDLDALGTPASITAIRDLVESHLQAGRMNDCGLATAAAAGNFATLTWTYNTATGCPAPLILTIERGYSFQSIVLGNTLNVMSTRVTLQYPYQWQFNRVIGLMAPGATYPGVSQIMTDAIVPNMD
jgi:Flp pilus assembly protein TadG